MDGFVGGDTEVVAGVGEHLVRVGDDLGHGVQAMRAALGRGAGAVGHRATAAAVEACSATWCGGLAAVAVQVAVVAALATSGAADLARVDR